VTKHHLFTKNSNLISRSINITRSLHVKRPTLNIITWLPSPPPSGAIKAKFGLYLITQANHSIILEVAHFKFQRFLRSLPPLYITKHPLILFSPNFASYFHIKTLIKTEFIRWTQPLIFVWLQRSWDHYSMGSWWHQYFCGSLILRMAIFCVCFAGLIFAIEETVYSSLELIFAIFRKPPSIWNYNILVFWV